MAITYDLVDVTPELAQAWLQNANKHNRPLREYRAAELARDMREDRWHDTGEPIKFDVNDVLLDGQHRLLAITLAGVTIRMFVVRGLPPETQDYMDIGMKRSVADALHLEGLVKRSPNVVASIARSLLSLDAGAVGGNDPKKRPTHAEVLEYVRKNVDGLEESAYVYLKARDGGLKGGVIYGIAYYKLAQVDHDDAVDFFQRLINGEDLRGGNPIYALRQKLLINPPDRSSRSIRHELFYFIKAWNYWRERKDLRVLRWTRNEEYPEAV